MPDTSPLMTGNNWFCNDDVEMTRCNFIPQLGLNFYPIESPDMEQSKSILAI